ncbi:MAG: PEP/pyruvate-binding domain-containing protein [Polyangiales bacterium]
MSILIDLSSERARDVAQVGSKACSLASLAREGFRVPAAVVVDSAAFDRAIDALGLREALVALHEDRSIDEPSLRERATEIQACIRRSSLEPPLIDAVRAWVTDESARWAVRSSAIAEDLGDASFAGVYESVLGARGADAVIDAIRQCWASFVSAHAISYRRRHATTNFRGAVLVQALIDADAAGVAFTREPTTGATDVVVIESTRGLGEALVSGHVSPDAFWVRKRDGVILRSRIVEKRSATRLAPQGVELVALDERQSFAASIDDRTARAIAAVATQIERVRERCVDVEWATAGGALWVLQARAITAGASSQDARTSIDVSDDFVPALQSKIDPRFVCYSRGNIGEVLPGCVTPLAFSLSVPPLEHAFRSMGASTGVLPALGEEPVILGMFFHRLYLNVSVFLAMADASPGASRDAVYEELVGPVSERSSAFKWSDLRPSRIKQGLRVWGAALAQDKRAESDLAECVRELDRERARIDEFPPEQWALDRFVSEPLLVARRSRAVDVHIVISQGASSNYRFLKEQCAKHLGDERGSLAALLVSGIGSLASADPAVAIDTLAREALAHATVRALFEHEHDDRALWSALQARRMSDEGAAAFLRAFEVFLVRHGHRGVGEGDFRNATWREEPPRVLAFVRAQLATGGVEASARLDRQRALAERARAESAARIGALSRSVFTAVLQGSLRYLRLREESKDVVMRFGDLTRRVVRALSARLVEAQRLHTEDDVHFCTVNELLAMARGELDREQIESIVAARRADFARCEAIDVPKLIEGRARWIRAQAREAPSGALAGVAASAGVFEGTARVLSDPSDGARLEKGDVLVAPVTDLAWTPLFSRAGAVVVEVGGLLSHGSVVAREYGLPAVVGVAGALGVIRDGARVRVDGDRGEVTVLAP